jgi:two-component system phosphate regulon sensor histidine kinase PhoR
MWDVARLRQHRRVILLFLLMVLLPALIFSVLIIRALRGEQMQAVHQKTERQRQIVGLVEADLKTWLFTTQREGAISRALFRFHLEGDHIVFPELRLALPAAGSPPPRPTTAPPRGAPTAQVITDFYYPRIQIFLRDFKAGAQYFLRLGSLVVLLPAGDRGYVVEAEPLTDHVNQHLAKLCAAENFRGILSIGDLRDTRLPPATDTFGLDGFSFFHVDFHDSATAATEVRQHAFGYSMALLVLVTMLGSILLYRAVSQEARLSRLRSDFVSAVSHEFRSPLSAILALSERVESARVRDPAKLTEYLQVIGQEARRLSALVTRLLDFAQIEEGKKIYSLERVELVAIAREAIQFCRYTVRQERIRLCGEEAAPLWVRADRTALQHCIQNLIENAVKYSPPDSPIAVTCASVNGSSVVEVHDRGIGIPPAEQEKIFEKFYRGGQASELNIQGVGIGLALVKGVMERHDGSVSVESQPGQGSRFRLHLPSAEV